MNARHGYTRRFLFVKIVTFNIRITFVHSEFDLIWTKELSKVGKNPCNMEIIALF